MAGLFPANTVAVFQHFFQYIPVPYWGADQTDIIFIAKLMEAKIAHDSTHDGAACEQTLVPHVPATDCHRLVSVYNVPLFIDHQAAVCVAVKSNPQVVLASCDHCGQALQIGRAAF